MSASAKAYELTLWTKGTASAVPSDMGLMRPLGPEVHFFSEHCNLRKTGDLVWRCGKASLRG
jgi:hypothetical protein